MKRKKHRKTTGSRRRGAAVLIVALLAVAAAVFVVGARAGARRDRAEFLRVASSLLKIQHAPYVVSSFKLWSERPGGSVLLMTWSDGEVWTADPEDPGAWTRVGGVREGGL